jgi:uncharacterized protein YkwD
LKITQHLGRSLALLAVIAAVVVAAPTGVPGSADTARAVVGDCTAGADWGTLRNDLATQVVQLVNQHRASLGLSQLTVTTPLTNAAVWKSRHMAYYRYMQHEDPAPPVARSVGDRLLACGYPALTAGWGENIAYGYATAAAVMQGWLNSAGHRANIERASYRAIGVAAATSSTGTVYWTQEFGTSTTGGSTPPPPPPAPSYACSNGADDDADGKVDYPADPGCTSTTDNDEYNAAPPPPPAPSYACSNGADDDGDGKVDYPADPGCTSTVDNDEYNAAPAPTPTPVPTQPACSNGKDDDGDGKVDYPADPGCTGPSDSTETAGLFG